MTVALKDIKFYKTTGGLGGAITGTELLSQIATLSSAISGVSVVDAADNALGTGSLRFDVDALSFYYTPPSDFEGDAVAVSGSGEVVVRGAGANAGYVRLSITFGSLPVSDQTRSVTVTNDAQELFDDVVKAEALAGLTDYRCIYMKNTHSTDGTAAAGIWIHADSVGGDAIAIGLDPAGVGGTATTIGDDESAPAGVSFSTPLSEGAALAIAALAAGESAAIWIRRTVPAATGTAVADDFSWLRFFISS